MTASEAQGTTPSPPPEEKEPLYIIDPVQAAEANHSLEVLLLSRRCPSCQERLEKATKMPTAQEHISQIAECCALKEGFIRPQMSIQEIIFRILLSEGSKPTQLSHLHSLLTEQWATPVHPKNITPENLRKVLANDNYYSFRELSDAEELPA